MKYILIIISFLFVQNFLMAQAGCTDPLATNFNPSASENDGSCAYSVTNYMPPQVTELPSEINETSGLAFFDDQLFTHLDGGNDDKIFKIDSLDGSVLQTIIMVGTDNIDWEDLAQDEEHFYIGDFGNNGGNRMDLKIYKLKKADLLGGLAVPEIIEFSYSDQTDFSSNPNFNNYDCEAFFCFQDSLHLFSKNWVDFKTRHYVLPRTPGTFVADLRDSLEVEGQITAADINENGEALILGYNSVTSATFFWLLFDYQGNNFFSGNTRKINLGSGIFNSQVEGITFRDTYTGYISSERFSALPSKMLRFNIEQWVNPSTPTLEISNQNLDIYVFPNPFYDSINLKFNEEISGKITMKIGDANGKVIATFEGNNATKMLDLSHLNLISGSYYLEIIQNGKTISSFSLMKI